MNTHARRAGGLLVLAIAVGYACSGPEPTQPVAASGESTALVGVLDQLIPFQVLQRSRPLARDYTVSAVVGPAGGRLVIAEAGFSVTFPRDAVAGPTPITVTAPAGSNVAYLFQPHGLGLARAATVVQDVRNTQLGLLGGLTLQAGYFPDDRLLSGTVAQVLELRPAVLDLLSGRMTYTINHFSGYASGTSRTGGYIASSGTRLPAEPQAPAGQPQPKTRRLDGR